MKFKFLVSAFSLSLLLIPGASFAQSQLELTEQSCNTLAESDKELNSVYQQVLKKHQSDPVFTRKFRAAQVAWIKFRDAETEAIFPMEQNNANYGSVFPMCLCSELDELTRARVQRLKEWLYSEEGNACGGSRWP